MYETATVARAYFHMCSKMPFYREAIALCDAIIAQRKRKSFATVAVKLVREVWFVVDEDMQALLGIFNLIEKVGEEFTEYRSVEVMIDGLCAYKFAHYTKVQCRLRLFDESKEYLGQIRNDLKDYIF